MSKHADTAWHGCHLGDNDPDKEVIEEWERTREPGVVSWRP
ncbi:MAG TPA: hypothetical protein VG758_34140 [Hyphomicrobiaceae bacterium]|nr:hypothetical protein [Hyphomicrobiaceae bacterium]